MEPLVLYQPDSGAEMREDRSHRLALWREWNPALPLLLFVGLNPSTANETDNDPTIRRLIGFAKALGCGKLAACNLFTLVSPYPERLKEEPHNLHPEADALISYLDSMAHITVVAWGGPGAWFPERVATVLSLLKSPVCFKKTSTGQPNHPLYLPKEAYQHLQPYRIL